MYRPFLALPPDEIGSTIFIDGVAFLIQTIPLATLTAQTLALRCRSLSYLQISGLSSRQMGFEKPRGSIADVSQLRVVGGLAVVIASFVA